MTRLCLIGHHAFYERARRSLSSPPASAASTHPNLRKGTAPPGAEASEILSICNDIENCLSPSYFDNMKRALRKPLTLLEKMESRIARMKGDIFLRADFEDLGGYDQIGLVLRRFVREGKLLKLGQGIYARAERSIIDGKPVPVKGVTSLMTEALARVGVETAPTRIERAYNEGRTTQVPSGRLIGVNRRVRRKLGYNGATVRFELV